MTDATTDEPLADPAHAAAPIGPRWKDHWRALEQDPTTRRRVRREKRAERRRIHKQARREGKRQLEQAD